MKNEPSTATPAAHNFQNTKDIENHARTRMDKVLSDLQHEMAGVRTGRASMGLLDNVRAEAYGTPLPLNQLATLHVPDATLITVQPFDVSQILGPSKKKPFAEPTWGFESLQRRQDHSRVPIPSLTEERRKDLVEKVHHIAEDHRVALLAPMSAATATSTSKKLAERQTHQRG